MEQGKIKVLECKEAYDAYVGDSLDEKEDNYTLEDCVLVRTTDIFPFDKIIQTPINGYAYELGSSSIIGEAIRDKINKKIVYNPAVEKYEEYIEKFDKESSKYKVCFEVLRTTIHFTINGLVWSHAYGNFEGKGYIIIEPLKYHIKDTSLRTLRAEDTYFNDDMKLSDEAAIIMSETKFNEIKQNPEYISTLEKFKTFIYKGENEQEIVKRVLEYLGYKSFIISGHGYLNGISSKTPAQKMTTNIDELRKEYNISAEKHHDTEINKNDRVRRMEQSKKTDIEHFIYIINNATTITPELKTEILNLVSNMILDSYYKYYFKEKLPEYITQISLEEIARLTKEFNQIFIDRLNEKNSNRRKK